MKKIITPYLSKENIIILSFSFLYILILLVLWLAYTDDKLLLLFNDNRHNILNHLFIYTTKLAETLGILPLLLFFLLYKYSRLITTSIALITATLLTSLIKIITRLPRPKAFYESIDTIQLNFIPRVDVHRSLSFPSGHTAAAFAMFMMILLYTKNIYIKVAAFLLAVGVSLSRVYLSQHFTRDIAIGALLGIVIALLIQLSFDKFNWYNNLENKMGLLSSIINWKSKQKPTDI